jgi:hypothetical protein
MKRWVSNCPLSAGLSAQILETIEPLASAISRSI